MRIPIITRFRIELLERTGLNKYVTGDYEAAEKAFQSVLDLQPDRPGIRHNLALVWAARGDFGKAEPLLLEELEEFGDHYPRLRVLGDLYYQWGKPDAAASMYRRALAEECPDSERPFVEGRIAVAGDAGKYAQALESRDALMEGNRLMEDGSHTEAAEHFRRAVEADPTNISAWNNLGVVLLDHLKEIEEAVKTFRQAYRLQPVPWIRSNLEKAETRLKWKARKEERKRRNV
jgi:tetratricopeptide (TPR) repeat protein